MCLVIGSFVFPITIAVDGISTLAMQKFVAAGAQGKFDYVYQINIHLEINDSCNHQQNPKACWALGKDHCRGKEGQGVCEGRLKRPWRGDEEAISGMVAFL